MSKEKKSELDKLRESSSTTAQELKDFENQLPVLSTGLTALDVALGCRPDPEFGNGGARARDYIEICGTNGSGKTAASYEMIRVTQERYPKPYSIITLLSEPGDLYRMEAAGVDVDKLIILGQYHDKMDKSLLMAGGALDKVLEFIQHEEIKLTVIDSIAALGVEKNEDKGTADSQAVAGLAHVFNSFASRWPKKCNRSVGLFLNHYKVPINTNNKMGAFVQPTDLDFDTIGGKTKDFYVKARILMTAAPKFDKSLKPHSIEKKRQPHELTIKFKVGRNKYGPPLRSFDMVYNTETMRFNNEEKVIEFASHFATKDDSGNWVTPLSPAIYQSGAWYYIAGEKYLGMDKALKVLQDDQQLMWEIQKQIVPRHKALFLDRKDANLVEERLG